MLSLRLAMAITLYCASTVNAADLRTLNYDGFSLVVDCEKRSAISFEYSLGPDTGNYRRKSSYRFDPDLPLRCQQYSTGSYKLKQEAFVRGQLVPTNHVDDRLLGARQTNYFTNIAPMTRKMHRGAWRRIETIIECLREEHPLVVHGGLIYGTDRDRDFFAASHGVRTPVAVWRIVFSPERHIAWIIPNVGGARWNRLDDYLTSVRQVELATGLFFSNIEDSEKDTQASASWRIPEECDPG